MRTVTEEKRQKRERDRETEGKRGGGERRRGVSSQAGFGWFLSLWRGSCAVILLLNMHAWPELHHPPLVLSHPQRADWSRGPGGRGDRG